MENKLPFFNIKNQIIKLEYDKEYPQLVLNQELLQEFEKPNPLDECFVISIFGREKIGKSKLMNTLFGGQKLFEVGKMTQGSKTTDGILHATQQIENVQVYAFDPEGINSYSQQEEIQKLLESKYNVNEQKFNQAQLRKLSININKHGSLKILQFLLRISHLILFMLAPEDNPNDIIDLVNLQNEDNLKQFQSKSIFLLKSSTENHKDVKESFIQKKMKKIFLDLPQNFYENKVVVLQEFDSEKQEYQQTKEYLSFQQSVNQHLNLKDLIVKFSPQIIPNSALISDIQKMIIILNKINTLHEQQDFTIEQEGRLVFNYLIDNQKNFCEQAQLFSQNFNILKNFLNDNEKYINNQITDEQKQKLKIKLNEVFTENKQIYIDTSGIGIMSGILAAAANIASGPPGWVLLCGYIFTVGLTLKKMIQQDIKNKTNFEITQLINAEKLQKDFQKIAKIQEEVILFICSLNDDKFCFLKALIKHKNDFNENNFVKFYMDYQNSQLYEIQKIHENLNNLNSQPPEKSQFLQTFSINQEAPGFANLLKMTQFSEFSKIVGSTIGIFSSFLKAYNLSKSNQIDIKTEIRNAMKQIKNTQKYFQNFQKIITGIEKYILN